MLSSSLREERGLTPALFARLYRSFHVGKADMKTSTFNQKNPALYQVLDFFHLFFPNQPTKKTQRFRAGFFTSSHHNAMSRHDQSL